MPASFAQTTRIVLSYLQIPPLTIVDAMMGIKR